MAMLPTDKLLLISGMTCAKIDTLLNELNVDLNKNSHRYYGSCPIHGGDNRQAFSLYPTGYSLPGFWKCRSHNCQEIFRPTILGFTRGVISHSKYGWSNKGDRTISFMDAVDFVCNRIIKQRPENLKVDPDFLSKHNFIAKSAILSRINVNASKITRESAISSLKIPAEYYIKRGYSQEILKKYDIGYCDNINKEMFGRIVFPVYEESYKHIIGCAGRSIHPNCDKCNLYHLSNSQCPTLDIERLRSSKWYNNKGFSSKSILYNYWFAKKHIEQSNIAILVEGPGDVLRLEEAGIHNSLAIFGTDLSDEQQIILESSGAMVIILLLDNDEAGQKAMLDIEKRCSRSYKIYKLPISKKDVGEMTVQEIQNEIVPILEDIKSAHTCF